jgi:hypothetical protein
MSQAAQQLIEQVRARLSAQDYAAASALLGSAPADRSDWTQHERDEVRCLEEFVENLKSPLSVGERRA